jgi:thioredoxin 1
MALEIISAEKFKAEIFDYTKEQEFQFTGKTPIILNFFAVWCGPCQNFAPILEEAAQKHASEMKVFKIDIDQEQEIPELFGIRSVPTTIFFTPNEQPAMVMGNIGYEGMEKALANLFGFKNN